MKPYRLKPISVPRFEEAAGFYTFAKRSATDSFDEVGFDAGSDFANFTT